MARAYKRHACRPFIIAVRSARGELSLRTSCGAPGRVPATRGAQGRVRARLVELFRICGVLRDVARVRLGRAIKSPLPRSRIKG